MMVKKSDENSLALNETVGENYSPTSRATDFTPSKTFETAQ